MDITLLVYVAYRIADLQAHLDLELYRQIL